MENQKIKKKKQNTEIDFFANTMEQERTTKALGDFNCQRGIFENAYAKGLNKEEGIFNRTAIFKTKE